MSLRLIVLVMLASTDCGRLLSELQHGCTVRGWPCCGISQTLTHQPQSRVAILKQVSDWRHALSATEHGQLAPVTARGWLCWAIFASPGLPLIFCTLALTFLSAPCSACAAQAYLFPAVEHGQLAVQRMGGFIVLHSALGCIAFQTLDLRSQAPSIPCSAQAAQAYLFPAVEHGQLAVQRVGGLVGPAAHDEGLSLDQGC